MREQYWTFYVQTKHKSFYYMYFQILFERINWMITAFLTLTTISCIAAWDIWKTHPLIWASIICLSQLIQALFPKLPYNDILVATKFMISSIDRLLLQIDHGWLDIEVHNLNEEQILALLKKYQLEYSELVNQFFSGSYLPIIKWCDKKAEESCKVFFSTTYHT